MKFTKTLVFLALFGSALMAADDTLAVNMSHSENGLSNIQKGFLYNSEPMIRNGIKEIRSANEMFASLDETVKYLPKDKQHMKNVAFNAAKRINSAVDEMEIYLAQKEMGKAHHAYSDIVNACTACHAIVRGW